MQAAKTRIISTLFGIMACQAFFAGTADAAVSVGLSDIPLFVKEGVEPNIYLSLDDSASMSWSYLPSNIRDSHEYNRVKSSTFNTMYYDPSVTYQVPVDANGNSLGNSSFTAAWSDGFNQNGTIEEGSCKVNLKKSFRPTWGSWLGSAAQSNNCDTTDAWDATNGPEYAGEAKEAYYYEYDGSGSINDDESYTKRKIPSEQRTNFANWYSYYRKRSLAAKSALSLAFYRLEPVFRLSLQTINHTSERTPLAVYDTTMRETLYDWISTLPANGYTPLRRALKSVGDELKDSDAPYRDDPSDPTSTARSCRQNFHIMVTDGAWYINPEPAKGTYGGNVDNPLSSISIPDNMHGVESYSAAPPYKDNNEDYLADLAFYYWITDLRPDSLKNNAPINITKEEKTNDKTFWHPKNDPANWQHLVNFVIAFGVDDGDLTIPDDLDDLMTGEKTWTDSIPDDAWHATINSRGRYLSAKDPKTLTSNLKEILRNILKRSTTAAPVSLNSGSVSSETRLFQVKFDSSDWSGELISVPIYDGSSTPNSTCTTNHKIGDVCKPEWEASCILDGGECELTGTTGVGLNWDTGRNIITYHPDTGDTVTGGGIPFRWSNLYTDDNSSTDQQDLLNGDDNRGAARLNYIRGDKSHEASKYDASSCSDCNFRDRHSLLGDIINSSPLYIGAPKRSYPDDLETSHHSTFKSDHRERQGMIYVGANDGMLHGFSASSGIEKIAYIPNLVFKKLASLTETPYFHTSFVDGQLEEGDAFFDNAWHTVLVGSLGYGGQGIFALDVTNPSAFSESTNSASQVVLWEYSDEDERDLGYTFGKPLIRKLNNGKWAAIFGNGYDSTAVDNHQSNTGNAAIYIVDISDGTLIKKISTQKGRAQDPIEADRPNGITGIQPIDVNNDFKIDYIYAGDLFGNIWRFNLKDTNPDNWGIAFSNEPLYTAKDDNNNAQPITTAPEVGHHKSLVGTMVYFGTGKYLGGSDITNTSQQSFYAIWDRWFDNDGDNTVNESDFTPFSRTPHLLEQEILGQNTTQFISANAHARVTTYKQINWDTHKGWYLDLTESGERVSQDPLLHNGRIIFVTVTPTDDPCTAGGSSWLMELDASSGSRLDTSPFDYSGDGTFSSDDQVEFEVEGSTEHLAGSGIRIDQGGNFDGIYTTPAVLKLPSSGGDSGKERKYVGTSTGRVESVDENIGKRLKQSWREIMECGI